MNTVNSHRRLGRVIVIGAGLGGLTLAQGLHQAGVDVQVYEQDAGVRTRFQGYRIGIRPQGRRALLACLPERLHPLLDAITGDLDDPGLLLDSQGNVLSRGPGMEEDARVVDRHVFRHLLLAGLTERVHFGRRLTRFEERLDGTVLATFADGTEADGDVIVGADGGTSRVRTQLLPDVRLIPSDLVGAMGRTLLTDRFAALVPGAGTMVKGPGATLLLGRMPFRRSPDEAAAELAPDVELPVAASYIRWVMLVPPDHPAASLSGTQQDAREVVLDLIGGWHPDLVELIRNGDPENSVVGRAMVMDRPVEPWLAGRVTLLGDAVHLTLASGGNGANTALRDADLLCRRLVQVACGEQELLPALAAYQAEMLEYGNAAVEYSKQALKQFVP